MRRRPALAHGRVAGVTLAATMSIAAGAWLGWQGMPPETPAPRAPAVTASLGSSRETALVADPLLDRLDEARWSIPELERGIAGLEKANWRALTPPYSRISGRARRAISFVALTTRVGDNKGPVVDGSTTHGEAEARTWNKTHASYDAREALVAPPPAEVRFPVRVRPGARLEIAPSVLNLPAGSVTFEVGVAPRGGAAEVIDTLRVTAGEAPAWHDRTVDLSRFAGREIDLVLATRTSFVGEAPAALWGMPTIVAPGPAPLPCNVLLIVVDTLRPDPLAAWHPPARDAAIAAAELPPGEAWFPAMPSVVPNLDELSRRGVSFVDATASATWTRPGTLAILAGARSSELGLDTTPWVLPAATVSRFYASDPPLLPRLFRHAGARTSAFVNNFFLSGYARAGVDVGFPTMVDHRDEIFDTDRIVADTVRFLRDRKDERFFAFVNLNSPHNPYAPDERHLAQVPRKLPGMETPEVRAYFGEIAKDDDAVGRILRSLDELGLRERTIVAVTSDHGETLSRDHDWTIHGVGARAGSTRFRHATAMFEETVRIPLLVSHPGHLPQGAIVSAPVSNGDLAPTLLELAGLPRPARMSGQSLVPLMHGKAGDPERPIVSEGRAARSIRVGHHRYVERDPAAREITTSRGHEARSAELYDLSVDPGERRNVLADHPEVAARLRGALADALATSTAADALGSESLAGSRHVPSDPPPPAKVHLRFAGAGGSRRIALVIRVEAEAGATVPRLHATAVNVDPDAIRATPSVIELSATTLPGALVGIDLEVSPATTPLAWEISLDDAPLPPRLLHAGPFGLAAPRLAGGLRDGDARSIATSDALPYIDPGRDLGLFVTRDPSLAEGGTDPRDEALGEIRDLLEQWGYAAPSAK
jgi:arylsulfatase A-like enzyme